MNGLLPEITPILDSLGWAILHSLWQITLAASIVWLFYKATNEQHAKQRYLFAGTIIIGCFLTFVTTFTWYLPIEELGNFAKIENISVEADLPQIAFAEKVVWSKVPSTVSIYISDWLSQYTYWISLAWAIGFLIYVFKYSIAFSLTMRLRNVGISEIEKEWQQRVSHLIFAAKANPKTQLKYSKLVNSPLTVGFFKPLILVPLGFLASLPPEQVEAVLLHEIAHIKRHDYLINLIQTVIKTVFFYHPGIKYISTKIDVEREHLCDDFAIGMTDDPTSLAKALGFLQLQLLSNQNSFAMNSNQRNHPFLSRLKRLFGPEQPADKIRSGRLMLPLLLVVAAIFALTAYTEPQVEKPYLELIEDHAESSNLMRVDYKVTNTSDEQFNLISPETLSGKASNFLNELEKDSSKKHIWERLSAKLDSIKTVNKKNGKVLRINKSELKQNLLLKDSFIKKLEKDRAKKALLKIEKSELKSLFLEQGSIFNIENGKETGSLFSKGVMDSIPPPSAPPVPPMPPMRPFQMPPMPPTLQALPSMPPMPPMPPMNFKMNDDSGSNWSEEEWEAYAEEMEKHAEKYEEIAEKFAESYSENLEKYLEEHEEEIEKWSEEVERSAEEWAEKMEIHHEKYEEMMEEYRERLEKEPNNGMREFKKETNNKNDSSGSITPEQFQELHGEILNELIADGFRQKRKGFTHMWFKNGNLFINGDFVSNDLRDKYSAIFSKYNMAIPKTKFLIKKKSFDATNQNMPIIRPNYIWLQ